MTTERMTNEQKKLVENNLGLIKSALKGIHYIGDVSEMMSIGYYTICEAAKHYKPGPCKFTTYAYKCLRYAYLRQLEEIRKRHSKERDLYNTLSTDTDEDILLVDALVDKDEDVERTGIIRKTCDEILEIARLRLTEREMEVLYAIMQTKSLSEAGKILGITKQRVGVRLKTIREKIINEYENGVKK